ncbi:hypothetical protein DERF_009844 [Dermatophagoides farinae]|uniref:Uncharacterized protein n=1 Tax=Dermatophagoides farinae TaxID=6954 RepID=A0A922HYT3_DERFA|nr:hypothetical protein DERF_009844 [Dermatophagoides farinae]
MICLGSLQGGSRKQPRPSTVTTLLNQKQNSILSPKRILLTECDPPMYIVSWSPSELSLPNWFQQRPKLKL